VVVMVQYWLVLQIVYVVARAREVRTTSTNNTVEIGCHASFIVLNNCVHGRVCFLLLVACMHAGGWTLWRNSLRLFRITTPGHILLSIVTINLLYIRLFYHNTRERTPYINQSYETRIYMSLCPLAIASSNSSSLYPL
jgi:hypothetical protein